MSTEERNEPNHLLYRNWEKVFQRIPGFDRCACLRRVRCPDGGKDMDFLLVQPGPEPRLGLVECEGRKGKGKADKRIAPEGVQQLLTYLAGFLPFAGKGREIMDVSIANAFDTALLRGKNNVRRGQTLSELY